MASLTYHSKAEEIIVFQQCFRIEHSSGKIGEVYTSERVHSACVASNTIEVEMLQHHLEIIRDQVRD